MQNSEDREYVEYLKKDDIISFDVLFHKYSQSIFAFALSITRNEFAAEEITQLVFIKVWEKRTQINEHLSFKSFLFSITYNETISWLRKEKSEKKRISEFVKMSKYFTNETEQVVEYRSIEGLANQFIEEMPKRRREIFKLSRSQGFSNKEIAVRLGISVRTVEHQISSALKFLRNKLAKNQIIGSLFFFMMIY